MCRFPSLNEMVILKTKGMITATWALALVSAFAFVEQATAQEDFPDAVPLSEDALDTLRGGQGVEITSTQSLTAQNVGNSVNANEVDAFSSFNGVANVVVNTGHNNNLQGSVSVNVIYNDPVPASTP
jgi:hypothetical protein